MWEVTVEGTSKTTLLKKDGLPIARFYADRFNQDLLDRIQKALNEARA